MEPYIIVYQSEDLYLYCNKYVVCHLDNCDLNTIIIIIHLLPCINTFVTEFKKLEYEPGL